MLRLPVYSVHLENIGDEGRGTETQDAKKGDSLMPLKDERLHVSPPVPGFLSPGCFCGLTLRKTS